MSSWAAAHICRALVQGTGEAAGRVNPTLTGLPPVLQAPDTRAGRPSLSAPLSALDQPICRTPMAPPCEAAGHRWGAHHWADHRPTLSPSGRCPQSQTSPRTAPGRRPPAAQYPASPWWGAAVELSAWLQPMARPLPACARPAPRFAARPSSLRTLPACAASVRALGQCCGLRWGDGHDLADVHRTARTRSAVLSFCA